uniref:Uncharacterized protein n=1 Tax=Mycena chlorophos TaxID=658473 RepID=A0ABQ0KW98_MYCCL|nr:predicted protein [Mycena chlorophos]
MAERRYTREDLFKLSRNELLAQVMKQHQYGGFDAGVAGVSVYNDGTTFHFGLVVQHPSTVFRPRSHFRRVTIRVAHHVEQRGELTRALRIDARDVLQALQASISPVLGPARVGVPDESDPSYTLYFATIDGTILSEPHPKHLFVPSDGKMLLVVGKPAIQPLPPSSSSAAASAPLSAPTSSHPRVVCEPTDDELQWLTACLAATEGYTQFTEQHNRHLTNAQRVVYWKFAADFSNNYHKARWPPALERAGGTRVGKYAIECALKMRKSGLNRAVKMTRILNAVYFGAVKVPEVVREVEDGTKVGEGDALARFLCRWDNK